MRELLKKTKILRVSDFLDIKIEIDEKFLEEIEEFRKHFKVRDLDF